MKIYYATLMTIILFLSTLLTFLIIFGEINPTLKITPYAILNVQNNNSSELQYYTNMRFASRNISYTINESCNINNINRIKEAFEIIANTTNILTFHENKSSGKINISCNDKVEINEKDHHIKLGEGGINEVIKIDSLHIITKGKVTLFKNSNECPNPNVEIHEILHVLGFKHTNNSKDILYNFSNCNQQISNETIFEIQRLYRVKELPDLHIDKTEIEKGNRVINLNVSIINQGLVDATNITFGLITPQNKIIQYNIGNMTVGSGKKVRISNYRTYGHEYVKIVIRSGPEINISNNVKIIYL